MKHIQNYINHNTKVCQISFGTAFKADGALMNLPNIKDDKKVIVVGLTPYAIDLTLTIPFDRRVEAINITNWYNDNEVRMIEKLKEISIK